MAPSHDKPYQTEAYSTMKPTHLSPYAYSL